MFPPSSSSSLGSIVQNTATSKIAFFAPGYCYPNGISGRKFAPLIITGYSSHFLLHIELRNNTGEHQTQANAATKYSYYRYDWKSYSISHHFNLKLKAFTLQVLQSIIREDINAGNANTGMAKQHNMLFFFFWSRIMRFCRPEETLKCLQEKRRAEVHTRLRCSGRLTRRYVV